MVLRAAVAAVIVIVLLAAGCGDETRSEDGQRRQAAITIGVVIAASGVTVSRSSFSAGTIELVVSNQTSTPRSLELRSRRLEPGGSPLVQRTGPIPSGGTTTLTADVDEGTYRVGAPASGIEPSRIVVSPPKANAIDRLLAP